MAFTLQMNMSNCVCVPHLMARDGCKWTFLLYYIKAIGFGFDFHRRFLFWNYHYLHFVQTLHILSSPVQLPSYLLSQLTTYATPLLFLSLVTTPILIFHCSSCHFSWVPFPLSAKQRLPGHFLRNLVALTICDQLLRTMDIYWKGYFTTTFYIPQCE